jgi:hypothetical protein
MASTLPIICETSGKRVGESDDSFVLAPLGMFTCWGCLN